MPHRTAWLRGTSLVVLLLAGCSPPTAQQAETKEQQEVRETFVAFQKALKDRDADQLWGLFDKERQAGLERVGKAVNVSGKEFTRKDEFYRKPFDEVAGARFDKVSVTGDKATV